MFKKIILAATLSLMLSGCYTTTDVFCKTHTKDEIQPSQAEVLVMTPQRRRDTLELLKEGKERCGWKFE